MKRIGISYITYNRPALWKFGFERLARTLKPYKDKYEIILSISDDGSEHIQILENMIREIRSSVSQIILQTGELGNISHARNRSMSVLQNCDYIFLFEDDIYPIDPRWLDGYIGVLSEQNFGHVMYLPGSIFPNELFFAEVDGRHVMKNQQCGGIMLSMRGDIFDKVGGFYYEFAPYGFEHAEYTERCMMCQGLPWNLYLSIKEAEQEHWFVSADEFNHTAFSADLTVEQFRQINRGSIGQRMDVEMIKKSIAENGKIWRQSHAITMNGEYYRPFKWGPDET